MDLAQKLREEIEEKTQDLTSKRDRFGKNALLVPNETNEPKKKKRVKPENSEAKIHQKEYNSILYCHFTSIANM